MDVVKETIDGIRGFQWLSICEELPELAQVDSGTGFGDRGRRGRGRGDARGRGEGRGRGWGGRDSHMAVDGDSGHSGRSWGGAGSRGRSSSRLSRGRGVGRRT